MNGQGFIPGIIAIVILFSNSYCFNSKMSEYYFDEKAGLNGSFEAVVNGIPVNWIVYSPNTIPEGNYDLIIDTMDCKEGKQSLKFLVRKCSSIGGWYSPGMCMEYDARPDELYKISFWIKNDSAGFIAKIGGVGPSTGESEAIMKSNDSFNEWKIVEYKYVLPSKMNSLRFELNILKPGIFWIDNFNIEMVKE